MVSDNWGTSKWVRSTDGWFAGVCEGLGRSFGFEPWVLRLVWLVSILIFGMGLFIYIALAFCLPREDRLAEAGQKKFLGVCGKLSRKTGMDVGLVRFLTVVLGFTSLGATVVGYIVLYFLMSENGNEDFFHTPTKS